MIQITQNWHLTQDVITNHKETHVMFKPMLEIIPNWHPIFVHFTVALFSTAVGLSVLTYLLRKIQSQPSVLVLEFEIVARWCLWLAALVTIGTVLAGLYAYYTVKHDAISHVAMTTHRNWALAAATAIFLLGIWSLWRHYKKKGLTLTFIVSLLIAQALLLSTAWLGGEVVYRYGIGVISVPKAEKAGHQHSHGPEAISKPASSDKAQSGESHHQDKHE